MSDHAEMRLGPRAIELLRALCGYVHQHGNVHGDARWAAQRSGWLVHTARDVAVWVAEAELRLATNDH